MWTPEVSPTALMSVLFRGLGTLSYIDVDGLWH
jgi:hypothetical protein